MTQTHVETRMTTVISPMPDEYEDQILRILGQKAVANYNSIMDLNDLISFEGQESFQLMRQLRSRAQMKHFSGQIALGPRSINDHRKTLILDLDETLVHCATDKNALVSIDTSFMVNFMGKEFEVYVQYRPFMKEFLQIVNQDFEVVIFTASQKVYADALLNIIDKEVGAKVTPIRLFRDSCVLVDQTFVKDLRAIKRDLKDVVIVDNAVEAFSFQTTNGIPIKSWFCEADDVELLKTLRVYFIHLIITHI